MTCLLKINFTFISTFTKCISDLCAPLAIFVVEKDFFFFSPSWCLRIPFFPNPLNVSTMLYNRKASKHVGIWIESQSRFPCRALPTHFFFVEHEKGRLSMKWHLESWICAARACSGQPCERLDASHFRKGYFSSKAHMAAIYSGLIVCGGWGGFISFFLFLMGFCNRRQVEFQELAFFILSGRKNKWRWLKRQESGSVRKLKTWGCVCVLDSARGGGWASTRWTAAVVPWPWVYADQDQTQVVLIAAPHRPPLYPRIPPPQGPRLTLCT